LPTDKRVGVQVRNILVSQLARLLVEEPENVSPERSALDVVRVPVPVDVAVMVAEIR
jgi:hypothetical protein